MGHWYSEGGKTHHRIINKAQTSFQGKDIFRDTRISDARKHGWLPGFTAIGGQFEKPGLEAWKKKTMWDMLKKCPRGDIEPFQHWKQRVEKALKQELEQYAKLGSRVHEDIEASLNGRLIPIVPGEAIAAHCMDQFQAWRHKHVAKVLHSEQTFCSPEWGYGGCVDLQYRSKVHLDVTGHMRYAIVDFKTKRTTEGVKIVQGLEQKLQLIAYALGLGKLETAGPGGCIITTQAADWPVLGNLYLSTTEPGRWEYVGIGFSEFPILVKGVRECVSLWQLHNNFGKHQKKG